MSVFTKTPNGVLDFNIDWTDWLPNGETIVSAAWSLRPDDGNITIGALVEDGNKRGATLSGGVNGYEYQAVCKITTSQSRSAERSVTVRVMEL